MKHIAIFAPQFPVPSETFIRTEIDALRRLGHTVCVITNEKLDTDTPINYPIYELNRSNIFTALDSAFHTEFSRIKEAYKTASLQSAISTKSLLYFALQVKQLIKENGIDHIHCHFMHCSLAYCIVAAKLAGVGISSVGHGHDFYVNGIDLAKKLQGCDFNIAICQDMFDKLIQIKSHDVHLLHCGVDTDKFTVNKKSKDHALKLLFVGRLVEKKGLEFALRALASIPDKQRPMLDIIGYGPKFSELIKLVQQLNLTYFVNFLGRKLPNEINKKSANYDAFIAPFCIADNGDTDTGPVVLKEAMAMGLPVITTDIMGCTEIIDDKSGYTVPSRNTKALSQAILSFASLSKAERNAMGRAARKRVNDYFNSLKQAKKLSALIERVTCEY
jgi:glycosyltransferase involved in cell wall biosynthesis